MLAARESVHLPLSRFGRAQIEPHEDDGLQETCGGLESVSLSDTSRVFLLVSYPMWICLSARGA